MKKFSIEIKWALIFIVMSLVWMCFEELMGLHDQYIEKHATFTSFIAIPAIVVYAFALIDKKNNYYSGAMTWKQGFFSGLIITLIVTILSPLSQLITFKYIAPDYFQNAISYSTSTGLLTRPDAEAYFNFKNYLVQGLVGAAVTGVVISAIVALFIRKTKRPALKLDS